MELVSQLVRAEFLIIIIRFKTILAAGVAAFLMMSSGKSAMEPLMCSFMPTVTVLSSRKSMFIPRKLCDLPLVTVISPNFSSILFIWVNVSDYVVVNVPSEDGALFAIYDRICDT